MEEKLRILKLNKAVLWCEIDSLPTVSELIFLKFGKTQAEIMKLEREIVRQAVNPIYENDLIK